MVRILFIDDDKMTLKLVQGIFEHAGYSVITSSDPRIAIERLEKKQIDLVITDANMPGGMSGFDLVKTIRARKEFDEIPVAILTGRREKKDIQLGLSCGANDYIIKPIDPHILLGKVESLIKQKPTGVAKTNFAEGAVRQAASWELEVEIIHISERGITLRTPLSLPIDKKIKINSSFFASVGIEVPLLRVNGFTKDTSTQDFFFFIDTSFVGVTDTELQKVRSWIFANCGQKNKTG